MIIGQIQTGDLLQVSANSDAMNARKRKGRPNKIFSCLVVMTVFVAHLLSTGGAIDSAQCSPKRCVIGLRCSSSISSCFSNEMLFLQDMSPSQPSSFDSLGNGFLRAGYHRNSGLGQNEMLKEVWLQQAPEKLSPAISITLRVHQQSAPHQYHQGIVQHPFS